MNNPYRIKEPTVISFSGGRTSAYMLWRFIDENSGLPDDCIVTFANTGKEMDHTLRFVEDCGEQWGVPIVWLEYKKADKVKDRFQQVSFDTAARNGEPFSAMIEDRKYLPNVFARFCTSELKVLPIERYMRSIGFDEFQTAVGIRSDEPRRVAKMRSKDNYLVPFAEEGITEKDVFEFWDSQVFDLAIPKFSGFSNCDLCFLKRAKDKQLIVSQNPERAAWWADHEKNMGARFRPDHPSYLQLYEMREDQPDMFGQDEDTITCFCGD
jgi:3'-phosphoadenosine 5'-phosphosulfate sulfotransferase (PAPS reductase)/FAD synthetase